MNLLRQGNNGKVDIVSHETMEMEGIGVHRILLDTVETHLKVAEDHIMEDEVEGWETTIGEGMDTHGHRAVILKGINLLSTFRRRALSNTLCNLEDINNYRICRMVTMFLHSQVLLNLSPLHMDSIIRDFLLCPNLSSSNKSALKRCILFQLP